MVRRLVSGDHAVEGGWGSLLFTKGEKIVLLLEAKQRLTSVSVQRVGRM